MAFGITGGGAREDKAGILGANSAQINGWDGEPIPQFRNPIEPLASATRL